MDVNFFSNLFSIYLTEIKSHLILVRNEDVWAYRFLRPLPQAKPEHGYTGGGEPAFGAHFGRIAGTFCPSQPFSASLSKPRL